MSDDYDRREEEAWAQQYAEDEGFAGHPGCGGTDRKLRKIWVLFWSIVGFITMTVGKCPAFGLLIMLWGNFTGGIFF